MPLTVQEQPSSVVCFGKLPTHGDFVRYNAHGGSARVLDEWLQRGLYYGKAHGIQRNDGVAVSSGPIHFVFSPANEPNVLAGVIQPSRDRVGRRFPFVLAAEFERSQAELSVAGRLPLNLKGFLEWAAHLAAEAASGHLDHRDLPANLKQLPASSGPEGGVAGGETYLHQTTLKQFCEHLWDAFEDTRKYRLFKNLLDIIQPVQHNVPPSFPLGLQFPLCRSCSSVLGDVSFWLDVCRHLLKQPSLTPSFFWTPETARSAEHRPRLLVFLRPPAPSALAYLLGDVHDHETICDLERMGAASATDIVLAIPVQYGRLLELEHQSLRDFLNGL